MTELTFVGTLALMDPLVCKDHFGDCSARVHPWFGYEDFDDTEVVVIKLDGLPPEKDAEAIADVKSKAKKARIFTLEDGLFTEI